MADPAEHDFECFQGSKFEKLVTWLDSNDDPVNLTGATARMQIRRAIEAGGTPIMELTDANGRLTLGGVLGTISIVIDADDTAALNYHTKQTWRYDLEILPGGLEANAHRLMMGKFKFFPEVTR